MKPRFAQGLGAIIFVSLIAIPLWYAEYRQQNRRKVHVVEPGVLYRSGQLNQAGLQRMINEYGIRTVVTFRFADDGEVLPPDHAEEQYCRRRGLRYERVVPRLWSAPDGSVPAKDSVSAFVQLITDPTAYPILMHCFAGIHRTGAYCAIFRMTRQGWTSAEALRELGVHGYDRLPWEWDVRLFLRDYLPPKFKQQHP